MRSTTLAFIFSLSLMSNYVLAQSNEPEAPVPMTFSTSDRDFPSIVLGQGCKVHIAAVQDLRRNKQTVGYSISGPFFTSGIEEWMRHGLSSIADYGFEVTDAPSTTLDDAIIIQVGVSKTYTWFVGFKIFGMLVVKAQFTDKNGLIQEKTYRAFGDKTNMWGAQSELQTTLNYTANNLVPMIASDLLRLCKREKVDAYTFGGPEVGAMLSASK